VCVCLCVCVYVCSGVMYGIRSKARRLFQNKKVGLVHTLAVWTGWNGPHCQ
jgi:pyrrolidone-carboxylate peptidase